MQHICSEDIRNAKREAENNAKNTGPRRALSKTVLAISKNAGLQIAQGSYRMSARGPINRLQAINQTTGLRFKSNPGIDIDKQLTIDRKCLGRVSY